MSFYPRSKTSSFVYLLAIALIFIGTAVVSHGCSRSDKTSAADLGPKEKEAYVKFVNGCFSEFNDGYTDPSSITKTCTETADKIFLTKQ